MNRGEFDSSVKSSAAKQERLKSNNINYNKATNDDKENAGKDRIC